MSPVARDVPPDLADDRATSRRRRCHAGSALIDAVQLDGRVAQESRHEAAAARETAPANTRSGDGKASAGGNSMGGGNGPIGGGGPICIFAVKVSSTSQLVWLSSRKQVTGSLL